MSRFRWISRSGLAFGLVLATFVMGCAAGGPQRTGAIAAKKPLPDEFPLPASDRSADEPLSLGDARVLATQRNPELLGLGWAVGAGSARVGQAAALPNPELLVDVENIGGSENNPLEATVALAQRFELGGKRARRVDVAEAELDVVEMEHVLGFRGVTGRVTDDFVATLVAQERVALFEELLAATRDAVADLEADPNATSSRALDASRARIELDEARLRRNRALAALSAARVRLAASWGGEARRPLILEGELGRIVPPPSLDELLASADRSPTVLRWTKALGARRAAVAVERARRIPDVTLAAGYRRITAFDESTAILGLVVPVPLFDRNRGNVAAAGDELIRARAQRENARLELRTRLSIDYERLVNSFETATELRDSLVPNARKALDDTYEAYQRGTVSLTTVLQVRRKAYQLRDELLSAFTEYHRAVAEIEALVDLDVGPDF